jgi:type IV pilus assembly protein PilA
MKRLQQGFTLIELMIVVAIVGILAAIALPAYRDFTIRSKMSEVAAALGACKTSVTEYINTKNAWPTTLALSGCSNTATQYMASIDPATSPLITAAEQNTGATPAGCTLTLTANNATDPATWTGSTTCLSKFVPATFR